MTCIFCQIVSGEAQASIVHRDDLVTAFKDANPLAETHLLIIPNQHIDSVNELQPEDSPLLGHMLLTARQIAADLGVAENGFRLIFNTGRDGGQTVYHLHLHLIAGKFTRFAIG
jgi:histidine triad (HIT) family protein